MLIYCQLIDHHMSICLNCNVSTLYVEDKMTEKRFSEILKEYGFTDNQINLLWNSRPSDDLDEDKLRKTAELIAPNKDRFVQA
ncbi:MAG: hypothetical protein A2754_02455 [Candidatus Magasanikbacteria bacterium RIFCSPHIGHO2_01_FULL_47_8]|uniref:Uncharacterized protein n=1 Tax=Candidatus Magasanikbacteria bacterium RIFCSPHIGHO2_01_FULL_47_8 TaxID=1798673 RepID=A0A1F6MAS1_9BACT|nr:MAG: hypothetical protein A2754_02455 [Candidatus Magasanikbacteria bacterium RIFCSPHIGHO2_01_FULL_47_8]